MEAVRFLSATNWEVSITIGTFLFGPPQLLVLQLVAEEQRVDLELARPRFSCINM
jgi:hypothetical protein